MHPHSEIEAKALVADFASSVSAIDAALRSSISYLLTRLADWRPINRDELSFDKRLARRREDWAKLCRHGLANDSPVYVEHIERCAELIKAVGNFRHDLIHSRISYIPTQDGVILSLMADETSTAFFPSFYGYHGKKSHNWLSPYLLHPSVVFTFYTNARTLPGMINSLSHTIARPSAFPQP